MRRRIQRREARQAHPPLLDQLPRAPDIELRPFAAGTPTGELARERFIVDPTNRAVDPAETERLLDRVFQTDRVPSGVALVRDEPDLVPLVVVFLEPRAPRSPSAWLYRRSDLGVRCGRLEPPGNARVYMCPTESPISASRYRCGLEEESALVFNARLEALKLERTSEP